MLGYASMIVRYHNGARNMIVYCALFLEKVVSFLNHRLSIFLSLDSYSKYTPGFGFLTVVTEECYILGCGTMQSSRKFLLQRRILLHVQGQSRLEASSKMPLA